MEPTIIVMPMITGDGETHWLEGVPLLAAYLIFAVVFFSPGDQDVASKLGG